MRCILFDVEGTITSLSFVKDELFPFARQSLPGFVERNSTRPDVRIILDRLGRELGTTALDQIGASLVQWIDEDRKHPNLKELQGMVWEEGYRTGAFRGHLYPDVIPFWEKAKRSGLRLAIYSSGSIQAQRLLLRHSVYGDVSHFVSAHFDTRIGPKSDSDSYARIAQELAVLANEILFCSDSVAELDAAKSAGSQTCRLVRPGVPEQRHTHPEVADFTTLSEILTVSAADPE